MKDLCKKMAKYSTKHKKYKLKMFHMKHFAY